MSQMRAPGRQQTSPERLSGRQTGASVPLGGESPVTNSPPAFFVARLLVHAVCWSTFILLPLPGAGHYRCCFYYPLLVFDPAHQTYCVGALLGQGGDSSSCSEQTRGSSFPRLPSPSSSPVAPIHAGGSFPSPLRGLKAGLLLSLCPCLIPSIALVLRFPQASQPVGLRSQDRGMV